MSLRSLRWFLGIWVFALSMVLRLMIASLYVLSSHAEYSSHMPVAVIVLVKLAGAIALLASSIGVVLGFAILTAEMVRGRGLLDPTQRLPEQSAAPITN